MPGSSRTPQKHAAVGVSLKMFYTRAITTQRAFRYLCFLSALLLASPAHSQQAPWEGDYLFSLQTDEQLDLEFYMHLKTTKDGFEGYSRPKAANEIFGNWKTFLAKLFTSNFKNGSLLWITDGTLQTRNDSSFLNAAFRSAMGDFYFNAVYINGQLSGELLNGHKEHYAYFTAIRQEPKSLRNYTALTDSLLNLTSQKIYRPALTQDEEYLAFSQRMQEIAPHLKDDAELFFSFFYHQRNLPFSHYYLLRDISTNSEDSVVSVKRDQPAQASLCSMQAGEKTVAYLDVNSFSGKAAEIDSLFGILADDAHQYLIIDLRGNPGGTLEPGLELASHLIEKPIYGGVFLTHRWFASHKEPPAVDQYHKLPEFTANDFQLFMKGIHEKEGLALQVQPAENPYMGKLFILTDGLTASTSEPIVKAFKHYDRATIVGENTAGAMLSMEPFELPENFILYIPTAGYYAPDGSSIDQRGVEPDIEVDSEEALQHTLKLIAE